MGGNSTAVGGDYFAGDGSIKSGGNTERSSAGGIGSDHHTGNDTGAIVQNSKGNVTTTLAKGDSGRVPWMHPTVWVAVITMVTGIVVALVKCNRPAQPSSTQSDGKPIIAE